jgi:hypothetical protein
VGKFESAVLLFEFKRKEEEAKQTEIYQEQRDELRRRLIQEFMSDRTIEWINIAHRDSVLTVFPVKHARFARPRGLVLDRDCARKRGKSKPPVRERL